MGSDLRHDGAIDRGVLYDIEIEQALIGSALVDNKLIAAIAEHLRPDDFFDPLHQAIVELIFEQEQAGKTVTPLTLASWLKHSPAFAEVGGHAYLASMAAAAPAMPPIKELSGILAMHASRRRAVDALDETKLAIFDNQPVAKALADLGVVTDEISARETAGQESNDAGQVAHTLLRDIERQAVSERSYACKTRIDKLDEVIGGLIPGNFIVIGGRPGMGKAQPLDATVVLESGRFARLGNLKRGMRLASVDGAPSHVTGVFDRGERDVFRVTFSDGRSAEACDEHLWRVHRRDWPLPRILRTDQVARLLQASRNRKRLWIDLPNGEFGRSTVPVPSYLLGALLGDGDISDLRSPVLTSADPELVARARDDLGLLGRVYPSGRYGHRLWSGGSGGGKRRSVGWLPQALDRLGLIGTTSETKFVPDCYLTAPRPDRLRLLQGLLDTDGWCEKDGAIRFSSCSQVLATNVQHLVRSLGGLCKITTRRTTYTHRGERKLSALQYSCLIRHPDGHLLFGLDRKSGRARRTHNLTPRLTIAAVTFSRRTRTRCIAVSHPSRLYITDGFIVTHNTIVGTELCIAAAQQGWEPDYYSLEMPGGELSARLIASLAYDEATARGAPVLQYRKLIQFSADQHEIGWAARVNAERLLPLGISIFDFDFITMARIAAICRARAQKAAKRGRRKLFVIDHLGLIEPDERYRGRKVDELTLITRQAKQLAKRTASPVVMLSQLNRTVEGREDKRPQIADFRDSGSIEQDADLLIGLYRDEYYSKQRLREAKGKADSKVPIDWATIEFLVLKARNSDTGEPVKCHINVAAGAIRNEAPARRSRDEGDLLGALTNPTERETPPTTAYIDDFNR